MKPIYIIFIIILCLSLQGCFFFQKVWNPTVGKVFPCLRDIPADKEHRWDWRAGQLLRDYPEMNCVRKVNILTEEMLVAGEHFSVIEGTYCDKGHTWIEYYGRIIEPSLYEDDPKFYKEFSRVNY